jgi:hypothetical protein
MLEERVPANPKHQRPTPTAAVDRTQRQRITAVAVVAEDTPLVVVADIKAAVVDKLVVEDMPVAVAGMKAADTGNR